MRVAPRSVVAPLSSAIIAVLVAGLVVAGVDGLSPRMANSAVQLEPRGAVDVSIGGGPFTPASHVRTLGPSDRVRVSDGNAVVSLPGASRVELRAGSEVGITAAAARAESPDVTLDTGDLLVTSAPGQTVTVDGGEARITVSGTAKLRLGASLVVGVYSGSAQIIGDDTALTIPRYRQAAVVGAGMMPQSVDPLALSASDDWDERLMGDVLALDHQLDLAGADFDASLSARQTSGSGAGLAAVTIAGPAAAAVTDPGLYDSLLPPLRSLDLPGSVLAGRSAGENLIGLSIVTLGSGNLDDRLARVFGFRAEGASWGLVAADNGVSPSPVETELELALQALGAPAGPASPGPTQLALGAGSGSGRPTVGARGRAHLVPGVSGVIGGVSGVLSGGTGAPGSGLSGLSRPAGTIPGSGPTSPTRTGTPPDGTPVRPGGTNPPGSGPTGIVDLPPTGTLLDPILDPVVYPLVDTLNRLLSPILAPGSGGSPPGLVGGVVSGLLG